MITIKQIWDNILMEVEGEISTVAYDVYISALSPVSTHNDRMILLSPTPALKGLVERSFMEHLKRATNKVCPTIKHVDIVIESDLENIDNVQTEVDIPVTQNFIDEKERSSQFIQQYTFDNFIVGKSNEYAAVISSTVASNPGIQYNPLFIWGGVGLGKTHLLHAIGNKLRQTHPDKRTYYTSIEQFTNEHIESLRDPNPDAKQKFRERYRNNIDVLMIDDIQFLAGKEGIQEEFFHTFNDLYLKNKQIIICSDRPPREIKIDERLITRFSTGVIADIKSPDIETRIAILQKKCINRNKYVKPEILQLIAERISNNIREMEGVLTRIISYSELVGGNCNDLNIVQEALKDYTDSNQEILTIDHIVDTTCTYFGIDKDMLLSKKKTKDIVVPRQISMYLITDMLDVPLISIGEYFGGKDHSTISHARDKISQEMKENGQVASAVKDIKDKLYNR